MARRRTARGGKHGHKAKRLGRVERLPRFLRLGFSPVAGLVTGLGIGVLIGIAVTYYVLELPRPEPRALVTQAQSVPPATIPKHAEKPAPAPASTVSVQPVLMPPQPLDRSPFARPRMAERPEPPTTPGPNMALVPPHSPGVLGLAPPSPREPVVFTVPPPGASTLAEPAWRRYAVPVAVPEGRPLLAILIDDAGVNRRNAARVAALKGPLTIAYMTYADDLQKQSAEARAHGHELMLHVPMEPLDHGQNAGPNALETGLDVAELRRRLLWDLDRLDGYVGINNHMGSRFTAWEPGMAMVMEELRRRGLLFIDSRTIADSVADGVAERYAVPHADRDVFLDNDEDGAAVAERLVELEAVARKHGMAIGIGHPHDGTIAALAEWLPSLEEKGFVLVPVSTIVERRMERDARSAAAATLPPS